jgi:ADP-heptose:LPS heptosyltransferase
MGDPAGTVFVYHDGALGDLLLSVPALRCLSRSGRRVHLACGRDGGELLRALGAVDEVSFSGRAAYASLFGTVVDRSLREQLARFSSCLVFTTKPDSPLVRNLSAIIPSTRPVITIPPAEVKRHVAAFRLEQVCPDVLLEDLYPLLSVPPDLKEAGRGLLSRAGWKEGQSLVVLHPGSGGKKKCWPLSRYLAIAEMVLGDESVSCLFLCGPAEEEDVRQAIRRFTDGRDRCVLICDAALPDLAGLLALCSIFVGNDSGISHLAGLLDRSVLVLFGPTEPSLWRPLGCGVKILSADADLCGLPVDRVWREFREMLS